MLEIGADWIDDELVIAGSCSTVTKLICDIAVLVVMSGQTLLGGLAMGSEKTR